MREKTISLENHRAHFFEIKEPTKIFFFWESLNISNRQMAFARKKARYSNTKVYFHKSDMLGNLRGQNIPIELELWRQGTTLISGVS